MSLSKENIDKLNNFIKNKNLVDDNHRENNKINDKNNKSFNNSYKSKDPNKIFYSLIDNSETLNETCKVNKILRNSEKDKINMNSRQANYLKKLSAEEELYDEFNYLLDE